MQTIPNLGGGVTIPPVSQNQETKMEEEKGSRSVSFVGIDALLTRLTVGNILTPKDILIVQAHEIVATLLQRLRDNQLRCAVVYDTEKLYLGFVDAFDVASHILNVTSWSTITTEPFQTLVSQAETFVNERSGSLINISSLDPFETVTPDAPLRQAVDIMARGVHRLAVVENGIVTNILSQWDILMLMLSRVSFLGTTVERTIETAKLVTTDFNLLFALRETTAAIDVIKYLNKNAISAVPLLDAFGRITQNFSMTDVLNLTSINFPLLALPANEFLTKIYGFAKPPVVCRTTDTVENVLLKFACFGVHRVYVVNEDFRPIGVITLTDIMHFFLREAKIMMGSQ